MQVEFLAIIISVSSRSNHHRTTNIRSRHIARRISRRAIAATVRQIAERFQPEKIILFGSYAYGKPTPDSDVDLLVVMDTPLKETWQVYEIRKAIDVPHPLDLIVKTPKKLARRLELGDFFLREAVKRGKVMYERNHV